MRASPLREPAWPLGEPVPRGLTPERLPFTFARAKMSAGGGSSRGGAGEQGVLAPAPGKAGQGRELPSPTSTKTLGGRGKKAASPPRFALRTISRPRLAVPGAGLNSGSPPRPRPSMPCPSAGPPGFLALLAPGLALLAHLSLPSQAGVRRLPAGTGPQGAPGRTLILLDVSARSPLRVTSENFLSLQLDPSILHDGWLDFLSSRRLVTLARGLAPAFLRFAGKRTDFLQFQNVKNPAKSRGGPGPDYYLKNYEDDIIRSDIALDKQKGCKIAQHPDIMLELQREKAAQMHLVLLKEQFSNTYTNLTLTEPNNYRTLTGRAVNGTQLGKDYMQLKSLLQLIRTYSRASLYGPNIGRPRKNVVALLDGFMKVAGNTVDAVTWQHYYLDGRVAKVTDFLKTRLLDTLSDQIRKIQKVVNAHVPGKRIWLEGIGATSEGGITNLSDSYAASFLWLNSLGMLSSQGIDVVMRHSFFDHGHNHLVDQNFNPLPDYWLSLLYKRLVGPRVLSVHVAGLQRKPRLGRVIRDKLRIYAHCTSYHNHNYVRGSITLYIINLHRSRKKIKLVGTLRDKLVHQYVLQPYGQEGLHSRSVQLNGQPLTMVDDGTLPTLKPRPLRPGRTLVIPPLTMSFYVVKNVNALACRYR
ncbi:inactive heparanase-2 isoform X2 [Podarcis raffonei]|uniref:inactive heparanase-2 isoform X2 n=1 Tax=Podarcis raffonei TaxID=65483 RepID=UPI0023296C45|nr:inactive heparanase-2 isoform X2 [Podarcis raffonei]